MSIIQNFTINLGSWQTPWTPNFQVNHPSLEQGGKLRPVECSYTMSAPGQKQHFNRDADKLQNNQDNKGSGNHILKLKKLRMINLEKRNTQKECNIYFKFQKL